MYKIESESFGFRLTFEGFIRLDEMKEWATAFTAEVMKLNGKPYCVYVDMRDLKPLPPDAQAFMLEGQKAAKQGGMERSAVILLDALTLMQFKRMAKESGIYEWERYFVPSDNPDYESQAINWLTKSIDPDK